MVDKQCINPKHIVAYFDFDGTITNRDTFLPYLYYVVGFWTFFTKLYCLIPILLLYGFKVITNEEAKQKTLTVLLKGFSEDLLDKKARVFARKTLDSYIMPEVYTKLEYHLEHGHSIVLVSANLALYLNYWARRHNLDHVIATEIEFVNGICTGKLKTRNCYGPQKVLRIHEYLNTLSSKFCYSYGYGNSRGDYELLNFVDEGYFVSGQDITLWTKTS